MIKVLVSIAILFFASITFAEDKIKIVTSIVPLYNITKEIAGDKAEIVTMVPAGASPHTFSPRPGQIRYLAAADLFIQVGAGFEFWSSKMLSAASNKKMKIIVITDGIPLVREEEGHEEHEGHERESGNPHIWLDPVLTKKFSERICRALEEIKPEHKNYFVKNCNSFLSKLDGLDKHLASEIKKFRVKEIVSFHPAWVYFEKRYGLKEVGVIEETPGKEPTPRDIENIIKQIKRYGIRTIFAEPQLPRKAADVIAREAGVSVLILDPMGKLNAGYIDFIKDNFNIMKEAMK